MPIGAIIGGGLSLLGSSMASSSARDAASTSANAQLQAAKIAAEEARFRPVGVRTRFGTSQFTTSPEGRVTGAGYTISPELKAYQDRLMALAGQGLTGAEEAQGLYQPLTGAASDLFNLGQQYIAQSPEQVAAQYLQRQQDLLAPTRERQLAELRNRTFQTGREGLSVGATGARPSGAAGLGATNPELEAYYNALAQQDAALAANAQAEGQRQVAFGTGLFGTGANMLGQYYGGTTSALNPFTTYLGGAGTLESLGMEPLNIGAALGGRNMSPSAAQALLSGGTNAALTMQQVNASNPLAAFLQGAGKQMMPSGGYGDIVSGVRGLFGGGGSPTAPIEERSFSNVFAAPAATPYNWAY